MSTDIHLIDNNEYIFHIHQESFGKSDVVVKDAGGNVVTTDTTYIWSYKSGKEYTGNVDRREDGIYEAGTDRELQKKRIEFTPSINGNIGSNGVCLLTNYGTETEFELDMQTLSSAGNILNPGRQEFMVLFSYEEEFSYNKNLIDSFINNMIPAGLIPVVINKTTSTQLSGLTKLI